MKVLGAYSDASDAELADLRARMEREAQAAARIKHGAVVTVHDVTHERGLPIIVMELVDGPSLDEVVTRRGALDAYVAVLLERAQGRGPGRASDIWSLGVTLYAPVEGVPSFRRTSVRSTLAAIVGDPLPEPRRADPSPRCCRR
ncbi:hypothetical protein ACIOD1_34870 [Streptomyces sp. NPDC088097]|uniref:hypothetical protein n=1 Tax=Streptomyces sp. NPDC088097 TaxID=3365823 RepID=UPI00382C1188